MPNKDRDEERKNGARAPAWTGFGASGGGAGVRVAASAGRSVVSVGIQRTVGQSLLAGIGQFFSTGTGMVAVAGIVGSASLFTLWNINHPRDTGDAFDEANQSLSDARSPGGRRTGVSGSEAPRAPSGAGKDSLAYLQQGNPSASPSDDGQPIDTAAQAQAASAALEAAQRGSQTAPDNSNAPANTALGGALKGNMGQLTTNLGSGGGSTSNSSFFGGAPPVSTGVRNSDSQAKPVPSGTGAYGSASAGTPNTAPKTPVLGRSGVQRAGGGGAMGQLQAASSMSRGATMASSAEGQSYGASQAFEGTSALGASGSIGNGGSGVGANGGAGMAADNGNPINFTNNSQPAQQQASAAQNATPWQNEANTATGLLLVAGVLLLAAKMIPKGPLWPIRKYLAGAAAIMGGIVVALGVNLMTQYGQQMQGGVLAAAGGIVGVIAGIMAVQDFMNDPTTAIQQAAVNANPGMGAPAVTQTSETTANLLYPNGSTATATFGAPGAVSAPTAPQSVWNISSLTPASH